MSKLHLYRVLVNIEDHIKPEYIISEYSEIDDVVKLFNNGKIVDIIEITKNHFMLHIIISFVNLITNEIESLSYYNINLHSFDWKRLFIDAIESIDMCKDLPIQDFLTIDNITDLKDTLQVHNVIFEIQLTQPRTLV